MPEIELWSAVIETAIKDLDGQKKDKRRQDEDEVAKVDAQRFLFHDRAGLKSICEAAGLQSDRVRRIAIRHME